MTPRVSRVAAIVGEHGQTFTPAGLHWSADEIGVWNDEILNNTRGYKSEWDDLILPRANAELTSPEALWQGKVSPGCFDIRNDARPGRIRARGLRDAGFVFLLTGNQSYRDVVRDRLLLQIAELGTDFSDTSRWCLALDFFAAHFDVANWVRRLLFGYSYVRDTLTTGQKSQIDQWFLNAGNFFNDFSKQTAAVRVPGRLSDDYTCVNFCPGSSKGLSHFGGYDAWNFQKAWHDQDAATWALISAVGCLLNNTALKVSVNRLLAEWLKFAIASGGTNIIDQRAWDGGNPETLSPNPQEGILYAGATLGSVSSAMDHLARSGDLTAFEMTTEDGQFGSESPGNPKSFLQHIQDFAGMMNGTVIKYASTVATTDPALIIDQAGTRNQIEFIFLCIVNKFYDDADVKTAYTLPLPGSFFSGGYDVRGGDWGSYPAIRFMFAKMEGLAKPYPRLFGG